ncbi:MAG TPA: hypothetical protein VN688_28830, partial [Gemmataceae bacterium]|nr:hypothetical protein [Gemmataceae bacterium]
MTYFDIILSTSASLHPEVEPDEFISAYKGVIRAAGDDDVLYSVGRVHAFRVHTGLAAKQGVSLLDVFDAHSQPMCDLYAALFNPETDYFTDSIIGQFETMDSDLLILDYVVLNPRWRGLKLGLLAARKMVNLLGGGCGLVVSHVAPLRPDAHEMLRVPKAWLPRQKTSAARKGAVLTLRRCVSVKQLAEQTVRRTADPRKPATGLSHYDTGRGRGIARA